jgi:hypothetical protein
MSGFDPVLPRLPEDLAVFKKHPRRSGIGDENMASTKNRDILLVGSMRLASAEDVFRTVASLLGDKVHRILLANPSISF